LLTGGFLANAAPAAEEKGKKKRKNALYFIQANEKLWVWMSSSGKELA